MRGTVRVLVCDPYASATGDRSTDIRVEITANVHGNVAVHRIVFAYDPRDGAVTYGRGFVWTDVATGLVVRRFDRYREAMAAIE